MKAKIIFCLLFGLLVACQEAAPTPVAEVATEVVLPTEAATNTATAVPPTATADPPTNTPTPQPSSTPTQTPTFTPSPTPEPSLLVQVVTAADESPVVEAEVHLISDDVDTTAVTDEDGLATFEVIATGSYSVTITAVDYLETVTVVEIAEGENETVVALVAGVFVEVTADNSTLRSGPGTAFASVTVVNTGDVLEVVGRSEDGEWVVVQTGDGEEGWLAVSLVEELDDVAEIAVVDAPATPTAVPTTVAVVPTAAPPVAPPPAAPPTGANLVADPSFEAGGIGWRKRAPNTSVLLIPAEAQPQFIHSGNWSALLFDGLYVYNVEVVTPGQTYRAGAWLKIWSSTGEDRTISENPGDYVARICINVDGDDDMSLDSNVCSGFVRPLDVWQFITVDAIAAKERIAIILQVVYSGPNRPLHNEAYWDDVTFGLSPIIATPMPPPFDPDVRPNPVPFNATALRDNMNSARSALEQMGGLLDRLVNGSRETCTEYEGYYAQLGRVALYEGIPAEWQGIYNDYLFAVENGLGTNDGVYSYCRNGTGDFTWQAYGTGRQGINQSLDRLNPAIQAANGLLGG